jgi:hypothetical protein
MTGARVLPRDLTTGFRCASLVGLILLSLFAASVWANTSEASETIDMQIVAHEDDDFLFMNPDVQDQIAAGLGSVTVYTTAGEATGVSPNCPESNPCWESLAADRQKAIRAAYAHMAGLQKDANGSYESYWSKSLWRPDGVHWVELFTLAPVPRVKLIFMDLRDNPDSREGLINSVGHMYEDPTFQTKMIVPDNSELATIPPEQLTYKRAGVLSVLGAILNAYQPTVVRTLDPQPFYIENLPWWIGGCPIEENYIVCIDNLDHTFTARFADRAMAAYHGPNKTNRSTLLHYKGYSLHNYPPNLGYADTVAKQETAETYRPYDSNYNLYAEGYVPYYQIFQERYGGSTQWLERFSNGLLAAFSVEGGRVRLWHEKTPGGTWTGPTSLGTTGPFSPSVTVIRRPDNLLQLFALRLPLNDEYQYGNAGTPQDVMTAVQVQGTMKFSTWTSLGNPQTGACTNTPACRWMGPPTAAVDGAGRIFAFVKGSDGLVYSKYFSQGTWSNWAGMNSPLEYGDPRLDIIDGIAAAARPDGSIEVFATERSGGMQHFTEDLPSATFASDYDFPAQGPIDSAASSPTLTKNADGRLQLFYRQSYRGHEVCASSCVATYYATGNGEWTGPVALYGDSGAGPVGAITRGSGEIMLFERNFWHEISTTWQLAPNDVFQLQWTRLGGYLEEYPAGATDKLGHAVVVAKGTNGKLYLSRESGGLGSFGPFIAIGG